MNRKISHVILSFVVLVASVFSLGGCGSQEVQSVSEQSKPSQSEQSKPSEKVKLVLASQPSVFQPIIAQEMGFFEEEGLDVEINMFSYGPPIIEAISAKNADFGFLGDLPAFSGIVNGADIIIIGSYGISDVMHGIIARSDRGIESLEDLKGKTIAVPFGSNTQPLVYLYLEKAGLTENDVEILNLAAADIPTAIVRGDIDAAVVWEPNISVATKEGNPVKQLATAEGVKLFVDPIIARSEFTHAHPEETAKLLRALDKAGKWAHEHQEEAAAIQNKATDVAVDALLLTLAKKDLSSGIDETWIQAFDKGAQDAFKYGLITTNINARDYVKLDYLQAAGIQ